MQFVDTKWDDITRYIHEAGGRPKLNSVSRLQSYGFINGDSLPRESWRIQQASSSLIYKLNDDVCDIIQRVKYILAYEFDPVILDTVFEVLNE